jgi:hypothetical protein
MSTGDDGRIRDPHHFLDIEATDGRSDQGALPVPDYAERVADVPIFARPPQQADYSALWSQNQPARFATRGLRGRIHQWAKSHNDFFLRYSPGFLYDLALATLVRGLPRRGFRRRFYVPLRTLRR